MKTNSIKIYEQSGVGTYKIIQLPNVTVFSDHIEYNGKTVLSEYDVSDFLKGPILEMHVDNVTNKLIPVNFPILYSEPDIYFEEKSTIDALITNTKSAVDFINGSLEEIEQYLEKKDFENLIPHLSSMMNSSMDQIPDEIKTEIQNILPNNMVKVFVSTLDKYVYGYYAKFTIINPQNNKKVSVNSFVDVGAQCSMISKKIAKDLRININSLKDYANIHTAKGKGKIPIVKLKVGYNHYTIDPLETFAIDDDFSKSLNIEALIGQGPFNYLKTHHGVNLTNE